MYKTYFIFIFQMRSGPHGPIFTEYTRLTEIILLATVKVKICDSKENRFINKLRFILYSTFPKLLDQRTSIYNKNN